MNPVDPINRIEWHDAGSLTGNDYNPNVVMNAELKLLERSILRTGWVQPVLITPKRTIIDGFHRWMLAKESAALRERYQGKLPCAVIDVSECEAMLLTIRMNRAKGTHVAVRLSNITRTLVDEYDMAPTQIAKEIGASMEEVNLLLQQDVFRARKIDDYRYGKAWVPREDGKRSKSDPDDSVEE